MADSNSKGKESPATETREFNLEPHPRILMMLGEINLQEWQCIAELVDNSIDGFLAAEREGYKIEEPEIHIQLPTKVSAEARITVRDNGPGMDPDTLENAVTAGWTSNDPLGSLGLFGMGFNIATARLGHVTQVWSSRAGDDVRHGVEVNFPKLTEQRHFRTPMLVSHKADSEMSGTEVVITKLKPDQAEWFAKQAHQSKLRKDLGQIYSAILGNGGHPLGLKILVNGTLVRGRRHCVWGGPESPERVVKHRRYGEINAYQPVNQTLPKRKFCFRCWYWLPANEATCPSCGSTEDVVERERRIYGWMGVLRYVDETEFGIDFLRNGRKIERFNKDLFDWEGPDGVEREYPIDDPRHRGRIVGEIHLDHCRVTYTKDRFERNDPAWADMMRVVRGEGPLRPEKASQLGYGPNASPLFLLFQGFRRHNPKTKVAGGYKELLAVPDNDRAREMASRFQQGAPEFQSDEKWYELIEAAERAHLTEEGGGGQEEGEDDFWEGEDEGDDTDAGESADEEEEKKPRRTAEPILSREYIEDLTHQRFRVEAFGTESDDVQLGGEGVAWRLLRETTGEYVFLFDPTNRVFRSVTMTPLDALLTEITWQTLDFQRGQADPPQFSSVLASLRAKYAGVTDLDTVSLSAEASSALRSIARSPSRHLDVEDARSLFAELDPYDRRHALEKLASLGGADATQVVDGGSFLEYVPRAALIRFFERHPELFFDGKYWDRPFADIDLGDATASDAARGRLKRFYASLISDAVWLADQDPSALEAEGRTRVMRASLALELLVEDISDPEASEDEA